jgi:hypothetical protein
MKSSFAAAPDAHLSAERLEVGCNLADQGFIIKHDHISNHG